MPAQALHDAVDAVAGQPEHGVDAPLGQPPDQNLGSNLSHDRRVPHQHESNRATGRRFPNAFSRPVIVHANPTSFAAWTWTS